MAKPRKHGTGWRIRWTDESGRRQSAVFENYRDAEFALKRHIVEVEEVERCLKLGAAPKKRFSELCDYYFKFYTSQKRDSGRDRTVIYRHLCPFFGPMYLHEIGARVAEYKTAKEHLNKKTLHNHLTLLITMLRVAHLELNWLSTLPRIKKPTLKLFDKDFCYLKTDGEIRRFLLAAKEVHETAYYLYAFTIYTGLRAGEVAGLRWADVDFERRLISVCRSYDGPTKSNETRHVPITNVLLPLLKEWRLKCFGPIVFPNKHGRMLGESARVFQEVLHRTLDRADFQRITKNGKVRRYVVFHDLRHTFASHWMMRGGSIFRLQRILGHADIQITQRYSHLAPSVYSEDYDRFGNEIPGAEIPAQLSYLPQTSSK
jgi:integrase